MISFKHEFGVACIKLAALQNKLAIAKRGNNRWELLKKVTLGLGTTTWKKALYYKSQVMELSNAIEELNKKIASLEACMK